MKSPIVKLALALVVAVGVAFALRSQTSSSPIPSNTYDSGNDGRYKLIVTTGSYDKEYVIDTRTGRVWHSVVDTQNQRIVFVSHTYQNIDGDVSTIPNETATSVVFKPNENAAETQAKAILGLMKAGDMDGAKKIVDSIQDEALKSLVREKVDKALKQ
ncbi:MAG: hypothetical protein P4L87_00915 [Formivibrio sp.]|nr:hypothetical protein [Formivibrio sp.]